jgi:hypothetical protein
MRNGNDERISWSKIARCTLFAALILCAAGFGHAAPCTGQGTELQVLDSGGPETQGRRPHSVIGRIAAEAKVKHLVLSHRMLRTLEREVQTQQAISEHYAGPTTFADDPDCFAL